MFLPQNKDTTTCEFTLIFPNYIQGYRGLIWPRLYYIWISPSFTLSMLLLKDTGDDTSRMLHDYWFAQLTCTHRHLLMTVLMLPPPTIIANIWILSLCSYYTYIFRSYINYIPRYFPFCLFILVSTSNYMVNAPCQSSYSWFSDHVDYLKLVFY